MEAASPGAALAAAAAAGAAVAAGCAVLRPQPSVADDMGAAARQAVARTPSPLQPHMAAATAAALEAGAVIASTLGATVSATKINKIDLVTTYDPLCEELIIAALRRAFPSPTEPHEFIGESRGRSHYAGPGDDRR